MAKIKAPTPTAKAGRIAAPTPPNRQLPDRQRQIGQGMANPYARQNYNAQLAQDQANTRRILAQIPGAIFGQPAQGSWMGAASNAAAMQGRYPTTGFSPLNPQMSQYGPGNTGYNRNLILNNQLRAGTMTPYGPQPAQRGSFGQQQYQVGPQAPASPPRAPNAPQYQYGYPPTQQPQGRRAFQVIPGAPQWLQDQVGQQQMGWGSGNTDMTSRDIAYNWQMANYYAKGDNYTPPTPDPVYDYGSGWGYGGGGGGGYGDRPAEWYERMINWSKY